MVLGLRCFSVTGRALIYLFVRSSMYYLLGCSGSRQMNRNMMGFTSILNILIRGLLMVFGFGVHRGDPDSWKTHVVLVWRSSCMS